MNSSVRLPCKLFLATPVVTDLWKEGDGWQPGHIELADKADLLLGGTPATADLIAQFANGLAPDALSSIHLATRAKVVLAPAMNGKMYEHPATRENLRVLRWSRSPLHRSRRR